MFCPKCGQQNIEDAAFCRTCGATLSGVMAIADGRLVESALLVKQNNDLFAVGIRNVVLGFGIAAIVFIILINQPGNIYWLGGLVPALLLLATGITRLVTASNTKTTIDPRVAIRSGLPPTPSSRNLPPSQNDYIKPANSKFQTAEMTNQPPSVAEPTTRQLQQESDTD